METITLTITELERLKAIRNNLKAMKVLPIAQQSYLHSILSLFPTSEELITRAVGRPSVYQVNMWDSKRLETCLVDWCRLFAAVPGYDPFANFWLVDSTRMDLLKRNIIIVTCFSPSMSYHLCQNGKPCEVHLHDDGTATFWLPTFELAERYADMDFFRGSWKEAYEVLAGAIQAGWPMEVCPIEFRPLSAKL